MPHKDPETRRAYHRTYMKKRYAEDKEFKRKHKERAARNDLKYREAGKQVILEWKKQGCVLCGEKEACCLDAHHIDPTTKKFTVGEALSRKRTAASIKLELKKCACLCANCHRKFHAGILTL